MVAEIKTLNFFEGLPVQAPDQDQPVTVGPSVNANHAIRKAEAEAYADAVASTAEANAIASSNAYTDSEILALINSAPSTLDTLKELADALGSDANFSATVATALGNRLRVDTNAQGLTAPQKTNAKTNIDLENVDNTSDATKNSATATLTNKTLNKLVSEEEINSSATGSNATLTVAKTLHKLTNASLVSIDNITAITGMVLVLQNSTGATVTINDNVNIKTGTGANLPMANGSSLLLICSPDDSAWHIVGGSGSGGSGAVGGSSLSWGKNSNIAPITEYVDGMRLECFDKESSQEIYAMVTVPSGYVLGTQIKLKNGKFFNQSITGKVFFKSETTLINDSIVLGTYPNKQNSANAEVTVAGVANTINSIGELILTDASGLINGVAVNVGMKLLIRLFRDNASESVSALNDAKLLIDAFEIAFS